MLRAVAGRLAFALLLPVLAFVGAFLLTALAPGDPLAGRDSGVVSREALQEERRALGLDRPPLARLGTRVAGLARLDLGTSLKFGRPVRALVLERLRSTLLAGGAALALALVLGIPAGVYATRGRSPVVRHGIAAVSLVLLSVPALVLALALATFASTSRLPPFAVMTIALGLPAAALIERAQARALSGVLEDTALRAARARGIPEAVVVWRHAWPLSLPAVLGIASIIGGQLLSGALAIELVTARSGLGLLTFDALVARDTDLAAGCAAAAALLVGLVTLTADVVHVWIDPRTREDATLDARPPLAAIETRPLQ